MSEFNSNTYSPSNDLSGLKTNAFGTPTNTNGVDLNQTAQQAKSTIADNASAAYSAVANHPLTQNVKDTVANGPVAENVKDQGIKTQNEFSNLAAARTTPSTPAATGQQLTHYHSFFTSLLSWDNPRASGIAYVTLVLFIFGARYLNLLRYMFKVTYMVLGVTVAAEIAGKTMFSSGFTSQIRPKKYYVLPKETLNAMIGDVHELVNFFVIETQRILFAENVFASGAACVAAFISYFLIKVVPFWGLSLIGASVMFLAPLIYRSNKQFIDHHLNNASTVVNQQTEQVKNIATHHASVAANTTKQYVGDYSAKAQEMIGGRARSQSPVASKSSKTTSVKPTSGIESVPMNESTMADTTFSPTPAVPSTHSGAASSAPQYSNDDFPAAPQEPFVKATPIANEFITAPTVGDSASLLREEEPLVAQY